MKNQIKLAILFLPIIILGLLHVCGADYATEANRSWLQVIAFPFVLIAFFQIMRGSYKVPYLIYILAGFGALSGVLYSYVYPLKVKSGGVVIARLESDELENETRIFRENINKQLSVLSNVRASNIPESFADNAAAMSFVEKTSHVRMLVSGSKRWINIILQDRPEQSLEQIGLKPFSKTLSQLKIHLSVDYIGLSYEPVMPTSAFVSYLVAAQLEFNSRFSNNLYELNLLRAASIEAFWTSFAHRAYPWWLLGNYYLEDIIKEGRFNKKSFKCAIKAYNTATRFLRSGDNPSLQASLHNNLAVVHALRSYTLGSKRDLKKSKELLLKAVKIAKQKSKVPVDYSAAIVAQENFSILSINRVKFLKLKNKVKKVKKKAGRKHGKQVKRKRKQKVK